MDESRLRGDDAARLFVFGALTHAAVDVYSRGSRNQEIDGVIRAENNGKIRYWDLRTAVFIGWNFSGNESSDEMSEPIGIVPIHPCGHPRAIR